MPCLPTKLPLCKDLYWIYESGAIQPRFGFFFFLFLKWLRLSSFSKSSGVVEWSKVVLERLLQLLE